jgi:hypothetical protein
MKKEEIMNNKTYSGKDQIHVPGKAVLLALIMVITGLYAAPREGFIYADGTKLYLNGEQYKFAGINSDTWFGCWSNEVPSDDQLDRFFRDINPRTMTRIWPMPGADLSIMERIVEAAERHDQFLVPCLINGLADCNVLGTKDGAFYGGGYKGAAMDHVRTVVSRFRESPAIGFWEIANESGGSKATNFYNDVSELIKSLDPDHLVGTGDGGWDASQTYVDNHSSPNIDLISMHEYDGQTGASHWAATSIAAAQALDKPFYVGEDGFCCGGGDAGREGNASKLKAEFDAYLDIEECAGMLYWDFKLGHPENTTINFGSPMWNTLCEYDNPYQGGPEGWVAVNIPTVAFPIESPNIAQDGSLLRISWEGKIRPGTVELINSLGSIVAVGQPSGLNEHLITMDNLMRGIYLLHSRSGNKSLWQKVTFGLR